jgi:hypothetical protein
VRNKKDLFMSSAFSGFWCHACMPMNDLHSSLLASNTRLVTSRQERLSRAITAKLGHTRAQLDGNNEVIWPHKRWCSKELLDHDVHASKVFFFFVWLFTTFVELQWPLLPFLL